MGSVSAQVKYLRDHTFKVVKIFIPSCRYPNFRWKQISLHWIVTNIKIIIISVLTVIVVGPWNRRGVYWGLDRRWTTPWDWWGRGNWTCWSGWTLEFRWVCCGHCCCYRIVGSLVTQKIPQVRHAYAFVQICWHVLQRGFFYFIFCKKKFSLFITLNCPCIL